jgi:folate-binding protein YgfZ
MSSLSTHRPELPPAGFIERAELGRLLLRGADRRTYLHGVLTNDIQSLTPGSGRYAALLTPQGRMITDMHVYELGEASLITLPVSLAPAIRDRLDQYIFAEDAQVEDATAATVQYGVYGARAEEVVGRLASHTVLGVVPNDELGVPGFEVIALRGQAAALERFFLEAGAQPIDSSLLEVSRVEAGVPRFLTDMNADTIPLEAGIEDRAISMTKGCYPGQEVIVRVLHRGGGRVAKKLVGMVFPAGGVVPAVGEKVKSGEREIGAVTSAVMSPRLSRPIALGYVHRDFVAPGTRVSVGGADAEISALPFQASASADFAP